MAQGIELKASDGTNDVFPQLHGTVDGAANVTLTERIAGEDIANDRMITEERTNYQAAVSATTTVKTGVTRFYGIFVTAASGTPTIAVHNNTSGTTNPVINTFTPVAGTMYRFPVTTLSAALRVVIGGTVDCTVFYA